MVANAVLRPLRLGLAIACGSKVEQLSLIFQDYVQCDKTKATLMTAVLLYSMALAYTAGCFLAASAFSGVALFPASSWKDNTTTSTTRSYLVSPQIQDERFLQRQQLLFQLRPTNVHSSLFPGLESLNKQVSLFCCNWLPYPHHKIYTTFDHNLTCTQYHLVEDLSNYHESPCFTCGQQSNRVVPNRFYYSMSHGSLVPLPFLHFQSIIPPLLPFMFLHAFHDHLQTANPHGHVDESHSKHEPRRNLHKDGRPCNIVCSQYQIKEKKTNE